MMASYFGFDDIVKNLIGNNRTLILYKSILSK